MMKKFGFLTFIMLLVIAVNSCARVTPEPVAEMLKPGDKIGAMTVEEHSMSTKYPDLWDYCAYQPEGKQPGTQTIDCDVPPIPKMQFEFGWSAKDSTVLESNWNAMTWELQIDDLQIDLDEFSQWSDSGRPDLEVNQSARGWILDLNDPSPGKHTLWYLWTSEIPIDDGFDIYQPGTYQYIVNFTVVEK
jgi:hypothetical protein